MAWPPTLLPVSGCSPPLEVGSQSPVVTSGENSVGAPEHVAVSGAPHCDADVPPPIVAIPYVSGMLRALTMLAVQESGLAFVKCRLNPDDPSDYARTLVDLSERGGTFVVNEQDVVAPPGALRALIECSEPWCAHHYPIRGYLYGPLLGLAKFSAELLHAHPGLFWTALWHNKGKRAWVQWRSISERLASDLGARGVECHWHEPPAGHLHDYDADQSHWIVRP